MTRSRRQTGFTLLELMATMVVVSIVMAVVLPVITTSASRYSQAVADRAAAERLAYASDRVARILREIPIDDAGQAEITTLASDELVFADGSGVRLSGTELLLIEPGGTSNTLCKDVTTFELLYFDDDGATATADLGEIWSVRVRIVTGGVELRAHTFARERIGGG